MNRFSFISVFVLSAIVMCTSCKKGGEEEEEEVESKIIEGLTLGNYPKVDGSTSTEPLNKVIACELLGIKYEWVFSETRSWGIEPVFQKNNSSKFNAQIKSSQTHESFINLIDKKAALTLSARKMSPDEKKYADAAGVTLIETPIAMDAFVFIVNSDNSIKSLTIKQIQDIYTGKTTNWEEVAGGDAEINPYVRNSNSGSQELMELLVMKDLKIMEFPESRDHVIFNMQGAVDKVIKDVNSICYTVYYYKEHIVRDEFTKYIAIEGIFPDKKNIGDNSYPLVAEVYAVIRADLSESTMAYKIYEWLQTEAGKQVIRKSGYL